MEVWNLLLSPPGSAALNMAIDELLLRTATERGRPVLRVYSWEKPAVSFGYFQAFPQHLAGKYEIVRRPTGGGIVYHGKDTTFTVVVPTSHALYRLPTVEAYSLLHKAVSAAFTSRPALHEAEIHSPQGAYECFQKPVRGDVVADGRKLAGGAQRRTKTGMLHQGSIAATLLPSQLQAGFCEVLGIRFEPYVLTPAEQASADLLARGKYATDVWNHRIES